MNRPYLKKWEDKLPWLSRDPQNPDNAYCCLCEWSSAPPLRFSTLSRHGSKCQEHLDNVRRLNEDVIQQSTSIHLVEHGHSVNYERNLTRQSTPAHVSEQEDDARNGEDLTRQSPSAHVSEQEDNVRNEENLTRQSPSAHVSEQEDNVRNGRNLTRQSPPAHVSQQEDNVRNGENLTRQSPSAYVSQQEDNVRNEENLTRQSPSAHLSEQGGDVHNEEHVTCQSSSANLTEQVDSIVLDFNQSNQFDDQVPENVLANPTNIDEDSGTRGINQTCGSTEAVDRSGDNGSTSVSIPNSSNEESHDAELVSRLNSHLNHFRTRIREAWKGEFGWMRVSDDGKISCVYCGHSELAAYRNNLIQHQGTAEHKINSGEE
ncbi:hypothetical protein QAD02_014233 [Eretmocerus hayati]|uniref:Uncharacterized protein n=1 Tax=Eretmocerus hayati TaxID=131215 RepID=A0ACC2P6E3_9HYME|nr:hypothetical protein QAD02_014233 [Eretmocerus hayati]